MIKLHLLRQQPLQLLLENKKVKVNAKDHNGFTPLMQATKLDLNEIVDMLLEAGVDVDAKDNTGAD